MKKVVKFLLIIVIVICVGIGGYFGYKTLSKKIVNDKLDYERIHNNKTLTQYIENHDGKHCKDLKNCNMYFRETNFICDDIKDKGILYFGGIDKDYLYLITDDYSIYNVIIGTKKTYSNGQKCQKNRYKSVSNR